MTEKSIILLTHISVKVGFGWVSFDELKNMIVCVIGPTMLIQMESFNCAKFGPTQITLLNLTHSVTSDHNIRRSGVVDCVDLPQPQLLLILHLISHQVYLMPAK